jgi:hypothetical protein
LEYGDIKCPWIDKEALWQQAEEIRTQYWLEGSVPVDTEAIVEFLVVYVPSNGFFDPFLEGHFSLLAQLFLFRCSG